MADYKYDIKDGVITINGKKFTMDYGSTKGMWKAGTTREVDSMMKFYLKHNRFPSEKEARSLPGFSYFDTRGRDWNNVKKDVQAMLDNNSELKNMIATGTGSDGGQSGENYVDPITGSEGNARDAALNTYYKDLYAHDVAGTGGNMLKKDLEGRYMREANLGAEMADMQFQDAAMNQAAVIKNITDKVRGERMARLKSGMSEAQIANADMTMMMQNVRALNENTAMLGQQRVAANMAQRGARDMAFDAYMQEANTRAQSAAAFSAADAGNLDFQTWQRMQATGEGYGTANDYVAGRNQQ